MIVFKWGELAIVVLIEEIVPVLSLSEVTFEFLGCSRSILYPLFGFLSTSCFLGDSLVFRDFSTGFSIVSQYFWTYNFSARLFAAFLPQVFPRTLLWRISNVVSVIPFQRTFRLAQPSNQFWHRRQR
jgi:hypothetical protein